jgi:hypothetical protein
MSARFGNGIKFRFTIKAPRLIKGAGLRVLLFLNQPVTNEPGLYRVPDVLSKQAGDQFAMISIKVNGISLTSEFGFWPCVVARASVFWHGVKFYD